MTRIKTKRIWKRMRTNIKSEKGYFSLLDFINLSSYTTIRVYLAPREVLETIFPDKGVVDEIIAQRQRLHQQAIDEADTKELGLSFKNQFEPRRDPSIDATMLNFSVTKTNPATYQ